MQNFITEEIKGQIYVRYSFPDRERIVGFIEPFVHGTSFYKSPNCDDWLSSSDREKAYKWLLDQHLQGVAL